MQIPSTPGGSREVETLCLQIYQKHNFIFQNSLKILGK